MQGLATKGSRLGTKLREHEMELRLRPYLNRTVPPEFDDSDLCGEWGEEDRVIVKRKRREEEQKLKILEAEKEGTRGKPQASGASDG